VKFLTQTCPESMNSLLPVIQVEHFGSAILLVMGAGWGVSLFSPG